MPPNSTSHQVRQALDRVGMGAFFSAVFTFGETASRKPDPSFFQAIQSALGLQPGQLCMIGDSYQVDVLGAQRAGWVTVWYNPSHAVSPGLIPLQDLEIDQLALLPAALAVQDYPGYAACLAMLQQQSLSFNILAHVHAVAAAAYQLAVWLRAAGQPVDPLLAHRGGLLHDLAKGNSDPQISHGELAAVLLSDQGYPRLAEIAHRHMFFSLIEPENMPLTWEQKLVYFTDKLIEAGGVVSLEERTQALRKRYPQDAEAIKHMLPALEAMQEDLCAVLGFPASELVQRLKSAFYQAGNTSL